MFLNFEMKESSSSTAACGLGVTENCRNNKGLYARGRRREWRRVSGIRICRTWYIIKSSSVGKRRPINIVRTLCPGRVPWTTIISQ